MIVMENANAIGRNIRDFKLLDKIGSGGFAEVFKAQCLEDGYDHLCVAIKRISKNYIRKKKCEQRIKNEIKIHSELSYPAIVKFHTSFEDEKYWYLVLEFCGGGSLEDFIKSQQPLSEHHLYKEKQACQLIKQVIDGVQYLKSRQIIHRDLSLRNILLTENGNVKIADFGFADKCRPNEKKTSVLGTANFMSPEVALREPYGFKVDTWSVGCILYALLYGAPPYNKKNSIMNGADLTFPNYASKEAIELLTDMLEKDPGDRIEIQRALEYAFFRKYEKAYKKYESNNWRSGDSGMSSLSSFTSSNSRSSRKLKGTLDKEKKNCNTNNTWADMEKYSYRFSTPEENTRCMIQDDNYSGRNGAKSPCQPKLKKIVPGSANHRKKWEAKNERNTERRTLSHDNGVPGSVNQRKNKIQLLPSRQEIYKTVSTKSTCPEAREKWEAMNEQNTERETFSHDYETNSQDNILRYSCSHDYYCPPENNCLHKSSCCCHQSSGPVVKTKSNSDYWHHSYEREKKEDSEIRNSSLSKSLKDVITPLTTVRLPPRRQKQSKGIISILQNGKVCVEFLNIKTRTLSEIWYISPDGIEVTIYKPKKKILPSDKPPPLSVSIQEVQYYLQYTFENLPKKFWKKYQSVKKSVDIIRALTPKVTIYGQDAQCMMMENTPCPNYEIIFSDGYRINEIEGKITVKDQNGIELSDKNKWNAHIESHLDVFENMKKECCRYEACLSKECTNVQKSCFPAVLGRRPNTLLRNLDASSRSMHSSALNGTIAMKSYSTTNTDCSPSTHSLAASIPSLLSSRKDTDNKKNITYILPALKGQPFVDNGWVTAEYEDGIQMCISTNEQDFFFCDIRTGQRLSINQHPELMKRYHKDMSSVMLRACSRKN